MFLSVCVCVRALPVIRLAPLQENTACLILSEEDNYTYSPPTPPKQPHSTPPTPPDLMFTLLLYYMLSFHLHTKKPSVWFHHFLPLALEWSEKQSLRAVFMTSYNNLVLLQRPFDIKKKKSKTIAYPWLILAMGGINLGASFQCSQFKIKRITLNHNNG